MPTRRIDGPTPSRPCAHPEHNPPMFQVFLPGRYEHTCPGCGAVQYFTVPDHGLIYRQVTPAPKQYMDPSPTWEKQDGYYDPLKSPWSSWGGNTLMEVYESD